jgi:hypothetical protein
MVLEICWYEGFKKRKLTDIGFTLGISLILDISDVLGFSDTE